MNRREAIELAFEIKENPNGHDFSSYLYSAVGMVKQSPDAGTAFAAIQLLEAIYATKIQLSAFCKRKAEILEKECAKPLGRFLGKVADAAARADAERDKAILMGYAKDDPYPEY